MPKVAYIERNFSAKSLVLIAKCNEIIEDYQRQGFALTLRQLYYQGVTRNLYPNTLQSYKNLGSLINDARLAGLVDWEAIEDRGRNVRSLAHWNSPADIIRSARYSFRLDKWEGQVYRPEIWVEKESLIDVVAVAANRWDVPYFACKGYNSQSEQWRAGRRFQLWANRGYIPIVLHLGDHDSSGLDMTRDNRDRLALFTGGVTVERLALNYDQVEQYNPPPNPAKETDSRFAGYEAEFGSASWELDALAPDVIVSIIEDAIGRLVDLEAYTAIEEREKQSIATLQAAEDRWEDVEQFLMRA